MKTMCVLAFFVLVACSIASAQLTEECMKCITDHQAEMMAAEQDDEEKCVVANKIYACFDNNDCLTSEVDEMAHKAAEKINCTLGAASMTPQVQLSKACKKCLIDHLAEAKAVGKDKDKLCALEKKIFPCLVKNKCMDSAQQKKAIAEAKKINCTLSSAGVTPQVEFSKACIKCSTDHQAEMMAAGQDDEEKCVVANKIYACLSKKKCLTHEVDEMAHKAAEKINCTLGAASTPSPAKISHKIAHRTIVKHSTSGEAVVTAQVSIIVASVLFIKLVNLF